MKKFFNYKILLILIFCLGFFVRITDLGNAPSGFHHDEAAFGYNAYSILNTGKDEDGNYFPIVLKSFGDYKGAIYAYLSIPPVAVFGLTPFSVRFPSVVISTLTIILIFLFLDKLLNNKKIALIAAGIFAISPWDIMISRVTGDVEVGMFFTLLAAYALLFVKEHQSKLWLAATLVSSSLAIISYAPYRIYIFLIATFFFLMSIKRVKRKITFNKSLLFILILILALGLIYNSLASTTRFNQISIFSSPRTELIMQEQIREDQGSPLVLTRAFHNKVVNYARTILHNAGEYFTIDYLFLSGGFPQRERIPNAGLFYIWQLPFLIIGLYVIARQRKRSELLLVIWWIALLAPTFFTFDEIPNVHRNLIVLPAIAAIISIGLYEVTKKVNIKIKILLVALILIAVFEFSYFSHQYFIHYDRHEPWYRGFAYRELAGKLEDYLPEYRKVVVTKGNQAPYIYVLFYTRYDPAKYQSEGSTRDVDYTGFNKYFFVPEGCPPVVTQEDEEKVIGEKDVLYVNIGECKLPKGASLVDTVNWKDGTAAFKLIEYK